MEFFQFICSNSILVKIKETLNSSFSPFTTEQFSCIMYNFFSFSFCFSFFLSLLIYLFIFFGQYNLRLPELSLKGEC